MNMLRLKAQHINYNFIMRVLRSCLLSVLLGISGIASAQRFWDSEPDYPESAYSPRYAQRLSPEEAAIEQVRQRTGGQILSVRPSDDPGRPGFWVRYLKDGRVRTVFVPQ